MDSTTSPKMKNNGSKKSWVALLGSQHFRGKGACWSSEMGTRKIDKQLITHMDLHKPNNTLINGKLEHFWCMDSPWANTDSQDSPRSGLGGSHHLPPYIILYAWPRDQHSNVILSRDSQMGVPKFPKLRLLQLWKPITLYVDRQLKWDVKQMCSHCRELSNDMWHTICMQGN